MSEVIDTVMERGDFVPFSFGKDHCECVTWGPDGYIYAGGEAGQPDLLDLVAGMLLDDRRADGAAARSLLLVPRPLLAPLQRRQLSPRVAEQLLLSSRPRADDDKGRPRKRAATLAAQFERHAGGT